MNERQRYVLIPNLGNLTEYGLHYKDLLTYTTIRSYYNTKDKFCFPSYIALATRSGLSKKFISESIKRLECASLLQVWKIGKFHVRHCYRFDETRELRKVPFELLSVTDLTVSEKCILLLLSEFELVLLDSEDVIEQVAHNGGLVKRTVSRHVKSLILKGYLVERQLEDPLTMTIDSFYQFTGKLNWSNSSLNGKIKEPFDPMAIIDMVSKMRKLSNS